jgi:hypothetical protein
MKTYKISSPAFLRPAWFNKVRHGRHRAVVADNNTITLEGEVLSLLDNVLLKGEVEVWNVLLKGEVEVWLNTAGHFVCATVADIEQAATEYRAKQEGEAAVERMRLNAVRDEAQAFNSKIALPVRWDTGIKDVLSGLSPDSWGDGRNKSTVQHILLMEDLESGRIKRGAGDFLCSINSIDNGKQWSGQKIERFHDGDGIAYQPKVTCKSCLKLADRWMGEIK